MRLIWMVTLLPVLAGCAAGSASEIAICRETRDSREEHGKALLTPPTAEDDLVTGAQALAEIAAGCMEA